MGYYIRVFGKSNPTITIEEMSRHLVSKGLKASIKSEEGNKYEDEEDFEVLMVRDGGNNEIISIEKDVVGEGEFAQEEIQEFTDELHESKPTRGANWVIEFLKEVKVVYGLQILNSISFDDENWSTVGELKDFIGMKTNGIIQSDFEGFSNRDGYQVVWHFAEDAKGNWPMAVLDESGNWIKFEMDLANKEQRREFWMEEFRREFE